MAVIALTQGMGSLAQDIAEQLAQELGIAVLQHELAEKVADKMHVSKSVINRLRFGQASTLERLRADRGSMALYSAEEVLEAAARGNVVIRGWGATALLRSVPHVPCIRIMRPFAKRVEWLMAQLDTDDVELAQTEITRSDQANATRMQDQFDVTWNEPVLFDMVLNTGRLTVDTCTQTIKELVARPEFAQTAESQALLEGMALSARARSALRANEQTHEVNVTIESNAGHVTLSGIVISEHERKLTELIVGALPGVLDIDNRLRVMSRSRLFASAKN